ncbi:hypothetical protein K7X08_037200 [Anisodus acutangulus]|uniref:Uncharacterized protein n=1 Tax=Anisodus acutangulus TaxID=402998 RepID=A0A9Q1QTY6_9SOLA|nr:hypothetical protein K7X08_037200 [Anisodus acutangulus]
MSHLYIHLDIQKGQYACSTNHLRCFLLGTTLQWVNLAGLFARDTTSFQVMVGDLNLEMLRTIIQAEELS